MQTPTVTIVNFYFDKKRGLANGVVASGVGISNLIFPVMYRKLFDTFGINGAVIILGGILLNICVAGSFYRQPKQFLKNQNSDKKLENQFSSQVEACNECFLKCTKIRVQILTIFKVYKNALTNKSLLLYFISFSLALVGSSGYFLILPPFLESRHFAKGDAVLVLTVYGATDLICRYIVGLVLDYRWITVHTFYTVSMVIGGTLGIVMIFVNSLALHFVIAVIFATFPGALFQCRPLMVVEVGQLADLPSVFALIGLLSNTAVLIGFPVLGKTTYNLTTINRLYLYIYFNSLDSLQMLLLSSNTRKNSILSSKLTVGFYNIRTLIIMRAQSELDSNVFVRENFLIFELFPSDNYIVSG